MIRIVLDTDHPKGGSDLYCPQTFCDWCGERIDRADDGNFEYRVGNDAQPEGPIMFTHKRCSWPFREAHGGQGAWYWDELSRFPIQVAANLEQGTQL